MPPFTRIPPLLQPYLQLPREDSILLLTSTLGATANWLITRFLCDALSNQDGGDAPGHNVVLASWMREYDFWRQEARKGAGLDLERLKKEGRFAFVDGLSELCLDSNVPQNGGLTSNDTTSGRAGGALVQRTPSSLPLRGPPGRIIPAKGPPQPATQPVSPAKIQSTSASRPTPGHHTLKSLDLAQLKATIASAVSLLPTTTLSDTSVQRKTLIVLDNADLLLALNPTLDPSALTSLILALHSLPSISHILAHVQADSPLLGLSQPPQPLEIAQHNLVVKLGHMSRRILGVRVLDTGVARDVSGVIRVTEQKIGWSDLGLEEDEKNSGESENGKEFLYQVKGDGSVRVFERGAGGEG
ncbi:hypothetical protein EK21DRAFT_65793 [Setomelanomma holmii]|uniref:Uncharacterized protein n=1 Tax=Setomelanomma holmii TaxID=210430 RepID=A0A9P4H933_9PLEO|nr:hypothetical protein EK21DRAFT_65793 [Setomelanomma holmii]